MQATITTYRDPKVGDSLERTAIVADDNASTVILRRDGTPIAIINAFHYDLDPERGCIDVILVDENVEGRSIVFAQGGGTEQHERRIQQNDARVDVEVDNARVFAVAFGPKGRVVG